MNQGTQLDEARQRCIAAVGEARARIEKAQTDAQEIRAREELGPEHLRASVKHQALEEVTTDVRRRVEGLIREARTGVSGSWTVSRSGPGIPVRPWYEGLGPAGFEERDGMLAYLAAAMRVFEIDLEELERGEEPSAEVAAERDAAAAECAAYEASHPAPAGMPAARDRWSSGV